MKLLGFALMIMSLTVFAKSDQDMVDALMGNPTLMAHGIGKKDIRRSFKAASFVLGKSLKKECSVYLEGFAVVGVDEDCDDDGIERSAKGDLKNMFPPGGNGVKSISITLDTDMDGDGIPELSSYKRFVDNVINNFVPKAAEAQDYNSSRSNKSSGSRMDIVIGSLDVLRDHEKELIEIFKGNGDSERLIQSLSEKLADYDLDPKFTAILYGEFINSLKAIHSSEQRVIKLASLEQSDALYGKIARLSKLPVDIVKEIMKSATLIATKEISQGGTVELPELGSISIDRGDVSSDSNSRIGRNPQTGKEIKIAAKRVAKFKAGKALAETVK